MIARAAAPLLDWRAGRRRHELCRVSRDGAAVQEGVLRRLVAAARDTEFGLATASVASGRWRSIKSESPSVTTGISDRSGSARSTAHPA
jgi:hypothetical protein